MYARAVVYTDRAHIHLGRETPVATSLGRTFFLTGLIVAIGCGDSGTGPDGSATVIYGACGLQPNYVSSVQFAGRFRQFPVTVYIDLGTAAPDLQGTYLIALQQGFRSWQLEAGDEIAGVDFVASQDNAQVVAKFIAEIPNGPIALASSRPIELVSGGIIARTVIEFSTRNLGIGLETRFRIGALSQADFVDAVAGLTAHEFGHSMGIQTHPSQNADFLMGAIGFEAHTGPTPEDLNTLRHNYCRS